MLLKLARKGLVELISANFMMQFVGFGLLILLPRFVSEAEIGRIKVLQTYTDLLVIVAGLGMNTAILKLCAEHRPDPEKHGLLRFAAVRTLVSSLLVVAVVAIVASTVGLGTDPVVNAWLPVYALIVPTSALALLAAAYLQALKDIRKMARAQVLVRLQSVALILLATWQFGLPGFVISSVAAFALGLWPYIRLIGLDFLRAVRPAVDRGFREIAGYSLLGNVMNTVGKYADIYVLGLFALDPVQLGYYSLATIFVIPASVITSSIQTIVTPYLAEQSGDRAWFGRALVRTQLQTVLVAVLAAFAARGAATVAVHFLYDGGYAASLHFLDVLLVFFVLRSGYAVTAAGHIALGLTRYNFIASTLMAVLALALTYGALDRFGFTGVAWAKVATAGVMILVYAYLGRRAVRAIPREAEQPDAKS